MNNHPLSYACTIGHTTAHIAASSNALIEIPEGVVWVSSSQLSSLVNRKVLDTLVSLLQGNDQ